MTAAVNLDVVRELVGKLLAVSQKHQIQPELLSIIQALSQAVMLTPALVPAAVAASSFPAAEKFEELIATMQEAAEELDKPEVTAAVEIAVEAFNVMKIIMQFASSSKKLDKANIDKIVAIVGRKQKALLSTAPNHPYLAKAILEGINAIFWVFSVRNIFFSIITDRSID